MDCKIVNFKETKVVGMRSQMLQGQFQQIVALWKEFMPRLKEIEGRINTEFIALQDYNEFGNFKIPFNIWACVAVLDRAVSPEGFEMLMIPEGQYAKFLNKGMNAGVTYQRIMSEWLPNSGYSIDDRPHFQVMGENYKNGSPDSEEYFYIPIKFKN